MRLPLSRIGLQLFVFWLNVWGKPLHIFHLIYLCVLPKNKVLGSKGKVSKSGNIQKKSHAYYVFVIVFGFPHYKKK